MPEALALTLAEAPAADLASAAPPATAVLPAPTGHHEALVGTIDPGRSIAAQRADVTGFFVGPVLLLLKVRYWWITLR